MTTEQTPKFGETETAPTSEPTETTEEPTEESESEPQDYKALWETEQQDHVKTTNTLKSIQGNQRKEAEREAEQVAFRAELSSVSKGMELLMKATASGETEGLSQDYERVTTEAAQQVAATSVTTLMDDLGKEILATIPEGVDIYTAPEYEITRALWNQAMPESGTPDAGLGQRAYTEAVKAGAAMDLANARKETIEAKKTAAEARKKALDEVEANDLSLGGGGAGSGIYLKDGKTSTQRIRDGFPKGGLTEYIANKQQ